MEILIVGCDTLKTADTLVAALIVNVQVYGLVVDPIPAQAPPHEDKADPMAGLAVKVTELPAVTGEEHELPLQLNDKLPAPVPLILVVKA